MSMLRKLGIAFCVLGFIAVCILALVLNTSGPFAGLSGIQENLADKAQVVVAERAPESVITVRGRVVDVALPDRVPAGFDRGELRQALKNIDGVRAVTMSGEPEIDTPAIDRTGGGSEGSDDVDAGGDTDSGAENATNPEPTATAVPEPTAAPTATPVPTLEDIVANLGFGPIDFAPGTAELTATGQAELDDVAEQLVGVSGGPIEVQAHTDNVGDPDVNLLLSQSRAEAVTDYLIDRGVDAAALSPRGFGASRPIADNSTEQGRAANQRVAFVVEGN